jgi:hypothetical protein
VLRKAELLLPIIGHFGQILPAYVRIRQSKPSLLPEPAH